MWELELPVNLLEGCSRSVSRFYLLLHPRMAVSIKLARTRLAVAAGPVVLWRSRVDMIIVF